jgi:hypothetical protein
MNELLQKLLYSLGLDSALKVADRVAPCLDVCWRQSERRRRPGGGVTAEVVRSSWITSAERKKLG